MDEDQVGGWFRFPRWVRRRIENDRARALYELLAELVNNTTRTWRGTQKYLAYVLKTSIRTVQRWIHHLRAVGVIETHQSIDGRGYNSTNVYRVPLCETDISSPPPDGGPVTKTRITSRTLSPSLRSGERELGKRQDRETAAMAPKAKVMDGQISLFDAEEVRVVDTCTISKDTGKSKITKKGETRRCGTPTSRVVHYWLSGRTSVPKRGVIAGVGKAIKRCLESGVEEDEVRRAIDALMFVGRDASPNQLLARFNLKIRPKRPKKRDYEKDPLWWHQPSRSSMTRQRKIDTAPPPCGPVSTPPSTDETSTPSFKHSWIASARSIAPSNTPRGSYREEYQNGVMRMVGSNEPTRIGDIIRRMMVQP